MLSVNYGNFLRRNETDKAAYDFRKPVYQFVANTVCAFCLAGTVASGIAYAYSCISVPEPAYSAEIYSKAQALNNNLTKGAAAMKQGRPQNINVASAVNKFADARPSDVVLTGLSIRPELYVVKGIASKQESINAYVSALDFGKDKEISIASVSNNAEKGVNEFTINVKAKPQKQAAKADAAVQQN